MPTPRPFRNFLQAHRWFLATAAVGLFAFSLFVTDGTFRFDYPESFGSFYDYQAASLLHGRWDVPEAAVGAEAFVVGGKYYGYFGVTPALLRMPFVALGIGFGRLSRDLMIFYYAICLLSAYLILVRASRIVSPAKALPPGWASVLLTANVALGSTLLFLGTRAYIYHEAILCGAAFALAGGYCALRYLEQPNRRWWLGALTCGLLSVQARPSSGLFALSFTGCVALALLFRRRRMPPEGGRRPPGGGSSASDVALRRPEVGGHLIRDALVGIGCVLGILSFNAVGYLKFHTFDGAPFKYHVQYTPERLARFGGRNFHLVNVPFNFESYLTSPTLEFQRGFPFLHVRRRDPPEDLGLKLDLAEPMLGLPFAMPGLCVLALVGGAWAWVRRRELRRPLALLWLAAVPFALIMFMATATSHRYTGDFCPALIAGAALGAAALGSEDFSGRRLVVGALGAAAGAAALITLAISWDYQVNVVWGVPLSAHRNLHRLGWRLDQALSALANRQAWPEWNRTDEADLPPPHLVGFSCSAEIAARDDALVAGLVADSEEPRQVRLRFAGKALEGPGLSPGTQADERAAILRSGAATFQVSGPGPIGLTLGEWAGDPSDPDKDPPFLANLSLRGPAGSGGRPLALEFTVAGSGQEEMMIRGLGPSLGRYGIPRPLLHPSLQVFRGETLVATNRGWDSSAEAAAAIARADAQTGAPPLDAAGQESALVLPLAAGTYTVRLTGRDPGRGTALIEVYDLSPQ